MEEPRRRGETAGFFIRLIDLGGKIFGGDEHASLLPIVYVTFDDEWSDLPVTSDTKTPEYWAFPMRLVLGLTLLVTACSSDFSFTTEDDRDENRPPPTTNPDGSLISSVFPDEDGIVVTVDRISDGDSLSMFGPDGSIRVRLVGINAPESDECGGSESRDALTGMLASGEIMLRPWPADFDEFGRHLGFLTVGRTFVNLELVAKGNAVARAQSDHAYADDFEEVERVASDAGLGLWAADACGAATAAKVSISSVNDDADGDDRANPNGEWVEITNDGETVVDLTGWAIRDESTRHRYEFNDVELDVGQTARLHSGCASDSFGRRLDLYWCDPEPPIWNNDGDTVFLQDANGNNVDIVRTTG